MVSIFDEQQLEITQLKIQLTQKILQTEYLEHQNNRLTLENLRLRQHLNRCRKDPDESNWIDKKNHMLSEQSMITRRIYYVQPGSSRFAIWITDLDLFPCIAWLFEVD